MKKVNADLDELFPDKVFNEAVDLSTKDYISWLKKKKKLCLKAAKMFDTLLNLSKPVTNPACRKVLQKLSR